MATLRWINKILINMESYFNNCAIVPKFSSANASISLCNDSNEFNIRNITEAIHSFPYKQDTKLDHRTSCIDIKCMEEFKHMKLNHICALTLQICICRWLKIYCKIQICKFVEH